MRPWPASSPARVPANAVVRHIVTFGRVLREVGIEVGPGRVADALKGLDSVELARQDDVYWTLRQTLVARREDLPLFDTAFDSWFLNVFATQMQRRAAEATEGERRKGGEPGPGPEVDGGVAEVGGRTPDELLRRKDCGAMTPAELARAKKLIKEIAVARPRRRTRRLRPDAKGSALDVRGLVRASLSTGGDPVHRAFRSRADAPRKLVLILDVSGSMDSYARALLLYIHAARGSGRHRLVGRHPHRRIAQGVQRRVGATGAHTGRGRRHPLRRLRARRHGARRPRDGPARAPGVRRCVGQSA